MVQDFTDLPSRSTVHAPQWLVSQPMCDPVRLSCSRRKWITNMRGSTKASTFAPFTVIDTWELAIVRPSTAAALFGLRERAGHHDPRHLGAVLRRAAPIGSWRCDCLGGRDRASDRCGIEVGAGHNLRRLFGP